MMLAGHETATHGEIFLDGQPINQLAPEARNIGMTFQSHILFPHVIVAESVGFPLSVPRQIWTGLREQLCLIMFAAAVVLIVTSVGRLLRLEGLRRRMMRMRGLSE